jgi:hypothetical protein
MNEPSKKRNRNCISQSKLHTYYLKRRILSESLLSILAILSKLISIINKFERLSLHCFTHIMHPINQKYHYLPGRDAYMESSTLYTVDEMKFPAKEPKNCASAAARFSLQEIRCLPE